MEKQSGTNTIYRGWIAAINLQDAVTLGGAYDVVEASPVGLHGHVTYCNGR